MDLNQLLQKMPKPLLVFIVLSLAIAAFIYNEPLKDECLQQTKIFNRKMKGILFTTRKNDKIQFAKMKFYLSDRCKQGNSIGACREYFDSLRVLTQELALMSEKCQSDYSLKDEEFLEQISTAIQIVALVAWGDKPPKSLAERQGWLNQPQIQSFCSLVKTFRELAGDENYAALRAKVYREFPDQWPEAVAIENRKDEDRPRALITSNNPKGTLKESDVYQRSIFSVNCKSYM